MIGSKVLIRKPLRQHQVPPSSCNRKMSDHQCAGSLERAQAPFHAQDLLLNSSSWVGQVQNFRQEIRQSHYRNDPVKYDLDDELLGTRWGCSGQYAGFERWRDGD